MDEEEVVPVRRKADLQLPRSITMDEKTYYGRCEAQSRLSAYPPDQTSRREPLAPPPSFNAHRYTLGTPAARLKGRIETPTEPLNERNPDDSVFFVFFFPGRRRMGGSWEGGEEKKEKDEEEGKENGEKKKIVAQQHA